MILYRGFRRSPAPGAGPRLAGHLRRTAALLALWLSGASAAFAADSWYSERITTGDAPVRVEHLWSLGPKLRSETVFVGHPIVTLVSGERYVMYDRLTRTGVSIQRSPKAIQQDAGRKRPFANELEQLLQAGGEKVGTETVAGRGCDIYRLTSSQGREEVCFREETQVPLYRRIWLRGSGAEVLTRYLEWSRDVDLSDSFFQPPPDVQLESMTYDQYLERAPKERVGPAPPMHRDLLHGFRS